MSREKQLLEDLRTAAERGEGDIVSDGRLLPERTLMELYDVGRHAVRSALVELEREGLLFRRQGMGTFISAASPEVTKVAALTKSTSPHEIMEVREAIEPELARLAAMRATPSDIEQMKLFTARGERAQSARDYERWDNAFHVKIAQSARNELFLSVFNLINGVRVGQNWIAARKSSYSPTHSRDIQRQHLEIIAGIERRDPQTAEASMRSHIRFATKKLFQGEAED